MERHARLQKDEADAATAEAALAAELDGLRAIAEGLDAKIASVRLGVGRALDAGAPADQVTPIHDRLDALGAPTADVDALDAHRQATLEAREKAITARQVENDRVRGLLRQATARLTQLQGALTAEEARLRELESAAKEAAARARAARIEAAERARAGASAADAEDIPEIDAASISPLDPEQPTHRPPRLLVPAPPPPPRAAPGQAVPPPPLSARAARNARVRMQAQVDLSSESNFFAGFSTNLSDGGLFIATVQHVPLHTEVDVRFSLPSGKVIEARGVVRWRREVNDAHPEVFPGIGIQFTDLDEDAQDAVRLFVASREPLFYPD